MLPNLLLRSGIVTAVRTSKSWRLSAMAMSMPRAAVVASSHHQQLRLIQSSNKGGPKSSGGHGNEGIYPGNPAYGGDSDIHLDPNIQRRPPGPKTAEEFANPDDQKNWISYGFDYVDMKEDRYLAHLIFFSFLVIAVGGAGFLFYYYPDLRLDNWSTREAFLELERRKRLGLPLVDKNYVDPDKVILPTEEELGDTEVII